MFDRSTKVRLTYTIFVSQSFLSAGQIAIFTLLAIMAVEITGNEAIAGLPSSTLTLSRALAAIPIGFAMGRLGRRFGLTVSYSVSAVGALVGVAAIIEMNFILLLMSSSLIGMGRAGAELSRFAAGDMFPEHERGRMIGRIVLAGTVGAILGPLIAEPSTRLAELLGVTSNAGPWIVGSGLYVIAASIIFIFLRPEPMLVARSVADEDKRKNADPDMPVRPVRELLRQPGVQLAILSTLISQTVMVAVMVITPVHMSNHAHSIGNVSLVLSAHTLGMFGLSELTGRLIDRYGRIRMMIAGASILIISVLIAPLSTALPVLIVALFLLGLGWNLGFLAGSSLLSDVLRGEERTRMQGVNDMLVALAAATGSLSSGPIFQSGGYIAVAGVGLVLSLLFLWIIRLLGTLQAAEKAKVS